MGARLGKVHVLETQLQTFGVKRPSPLGMMPITSTGYIGIVIRQGLKAQREVA